MLCNHCGNTLSESAKFCGKCGQLVGPKGSAPAIQPLHRTCPACAAECKPEAKFCGKCGCIFSVAAGLGVTAPAPAPAPAPMLSLRDLPDPDLVPPIGPPEGVHEDVKHAALSKPRGPVLLGAIAVVLVLFGVFSWWLMSRPREPVAPTDVKLPSATEPVAVPAAPPQVASSAPAVLPNEAPSAPPAEPSATEQAPVQIPSSAPAPAPAPARARPAAVTNEQAQDRRAAAQREATRREAQARQREEDRARLNKANQTLDDLLK